MPASPSNPLVRGPVRTRFPAFTPRFPWIGADLQTVRNSLAHRPARLGPAPPSRVLLPLGDGERLWALFNAPPAALQKPTVVLIHGLTGDEDSANIQTSAAYHLGRGYPVLRLNLRGAGPSRGQCRGQYHAGRSEDLREAIAALPSALSPHGVLIVGVSLGGNMVLKFMAEDPPAIVRGAVAVSAPIDLKAAQQRIMRLRNALYHRVLLAQMKRDAATGHPAIAAQRLSQVATIYDFDDLIVAPENGFANAEDYYARASAAPLLDRIARPTLVIHAADDPWIPADAHLAHDWLGRGAASLLLAPSGGHVGFHAADDPAPWHDRCAGLFFDEIAG